MSTPDIGEMIGLLLGAFGMGLSAGYVLTKFKDALNQI